MERKDRDIQGILSEDGKTSLMFDKGKATEHRSEPINAHDHSPIVSVWKTEYNNFVMCIAAQDGSETHWMKIPKSRAHTFYSEQGLHHLVSDDDFERLLV